MKVALNFSDIIFDTTAMFRQDVKALKEECPDCPSRRALLCTLLSGSSFAASVVNFFNEYLIDVLKEFENTEYYFLCNSFEEELCSSILDILRERYGLNNVDSFVGDFELQKEFIADIGIDLVVTNNVQSLFAACSCECDVVCYSIYPTSLPLRCTQRVDELKKTLRAVYEDLQTV